MLPPIFPIYMPWLAQFHPYATLMWFGGVVCLWLTRYTHQLGKRYGWGYYAFSILIRPAGVLLIGAGWMALYAPQSAVDVPGYRYGWLPRGEPVEVLALIAIMLFFALGIWSVIALGTRKSFLFRHYEDRLVTHGPYSLVRHPQFLSAIGISIFSISLFNPNEFFGGALNYGSLVLNWLLFTCSLWVLAIIEERELRQHFGEEYVEYARRVPRLFPN
jgi:protein-S-isoprenylcysteine O-methyltransferase Ste14